MYHDLCGPSWTDWHFVKEHAHEWDEGIGSGLIQRINLQQLHKIWVIAVIEHTVKLECHINT